MIEVKHLIRQSLLAKLANLTYLGVSIPVDDENLTHTPATILGAGPGVQAYVLIQNQTSQDASAKCGVNENVQTQLAVTTLFTAAQGANYGNYAHADLIASAILQILFPSSPQIDLTLSGGVATLWKGIKRDSIHPPSEEYPTGRAYRNIIILDVSVSQ